MSDPKRVEEAIRAAFADVPYPGGDDLRGSDEGVEPYLLEDEFRGRDDWTKLDAELIDRAPDGYASALNFFSHAALRFYLPAYMIADLRDDLLYSDPVFNLCHGFEPSSAGQYVNPQRYGEYTWNDYARERFAGFSADQAAAVVGYLEHRHALAQTDLERAQIESALAGYWRERAEGGPD